MKILKTVLHVMDFVTGKTVTYLSQESLMDCALLYARSFSPEERVNHRLEYYDPEV